MPTTLTPPDLSGGSLLNLVAELEWRLTGSSGSARLADHLGARLPDGRTYVLVLIDGLGSHQVAHPAAHSIAADVVGTIDAPFPTTTTVSLATIATGHAPRRHGLLGYQLYLPETIESGDPRRIGVVNTIKWTRLWGAHVDIDTTRFLPGPNLWERLTAGGIEPITVQPGHFSGSALSRALYRGCRFEPVFTVDEIVEATVTLAAEPGRLILTYLPQVDYAAHVAGQRSDRYAEALLLVDRVWSALKSRLPRHAVLVGTADHGHIDFPPERQVALPAGPQKDLVLYGDSRVMFVRGDGASLADGLPATWVPVDDLAPLWGRGPAHVGFEARRPDGALVADDDHVLLHRHSDDRMTGHHGGLTDAERRLPFAVTAQ